MSYPFAIISTVRMSVYFMIQCSPDQLSQLWGGGLELEEISKGGTGGEKKIKTLQARYFFFPPAFSSWTLAKEKIKRSWEDVSGSKVQVGERGGAGWL